MVEKVSLSARARRATAVDRLLSSIDHVKVGLEVAVLTIFFISDKTSSSFIGRDIVAI